MVANDPEFEKVPSPELDQVPVFAPPVIVPVKDTVAFGTKQICWSNPALTMAEIEITKTDVSE